MEEKTYALDLSLLLERGSCALTYHLDYELLLVSAEAMHAVYELPIGAGTAECYDLVTYLERLFGYESADDIPLDEYLLIDRGHKLVVTSKTLAETDQNYARHGWPLTIVCGHDRDGRPALKPGNYRNTVEVADTVPIWPGVLLTSEILTPELSICPNKYGLVPRSILVFEPQPRPNGLRLFTILNSQDDTHPVMPLYCQEADVWGSAVDIYTRLVGGVLFVGVTSEKYRTQAIAAVRSVFKDRRVSSTRDKLTELDSVEEARQACGKNVLSYLGRAMDIKSEGGLTSWVLVTHAETLPEIAFEALLSASAPAGVHHLIFVYRIGSEKQLVRQIARDLTLLGSACSIDDTWLGRRDADRLRQ